ncbi:hypothetical protein H2200_001713 [Cladophialophora chaetospira]|uniref:Alcohol dehydrogenase n=1 Tax=Cladophialophora chaetospira TaxID=386627 RepID=A0AA39CNA5_9EURO|nr:hypothetical protein H2200_001713 [Cladophialophora chaetospira]
MATSIPNTQTAAWLETPQPGARFQIRSDIDVPIPRDGEVLIKLDYTGFCHSDVHSAYGETPMSTDIAGHEGVGHVVKLGGSVPEELLKAKVGVSGVQIAAKRGYKVIAIDSGESKREMCLKLGATAFLDFKTDPVGTIFGQFVDFAKHELQVEDEVKRLTNGFGAHAIIVTAGSDAAYDQAFKLARNYGTVVCIGLPRSGAPLPISPFWMAVRSLTVVGSSVGTDAEMEELLDMAVKGDVLPEISVHDFSEINDVMEKLARFEIGGRVVLKIPQ